MYLSRLLIKLQLQVAKYRLQKHFSQLVLILLHIIISIFFFFHKTVNVKKTPFTVNGMLIKNQSIRLHASKLPRFILRLLLLSC